VGWGIVCVLLIALWVRSNQISDRLHGRLWGSEAFLLSAKEGRIATVVFSWNISQVRWEWETMSHPVDDELSFPVGRLDQHASHLGFGWINRPTYNFDLSREDLDRGPLVSYLITKALVNSGVISMKVPLRLNGAGPLVPIWFLVVLTSALATLPWIQWTSRFTLRTLLIATTLVAVVLGLVVYASR
jgi:hypothetical protein